MPKSRTRRRIARRPHGWARRPLATGLCLSLVAHGALVMGARVSVVPRGTQADPGADAAELDFLSFTDLPEELRLGIDESDARTDTWVGFRDSTPHAARRSEVEQSAMTPEPGGGPPVPPAVAAASSSDPGPAMPSESAEASVEAMVSSQEIESSEAQPAPPRIPVVVTNMAPEAIEPIEGPDAAARPQEPITLPEEWAEFPEFDPTPPETAAHESALERTQEPLADPAADTSPDTLVEQAPEPPAIPTEVPPSDPPVILPTGPGTPDAAPIALESIAQTESVEFDPAAPADQGREDAALDRAQPPEPFAFLFAPLVRPRSLPPDDPAAAAAQSPEVELAEAADRPPLESPESPPTPQASREDAGDGQAPQASRGNPGGAGTPGERSESESSAASRQEPLEVRPGRVVAAEGLQITTVRPVFAIATMVMANPRSPTVVIEFGRDGRVRNAAFVEGRTTGSRDVDLPLLDAIYRWTARGRGLESLGDDPEATISIRMRILLR
ncbi:MAG: hypothetical protein KDA05_05000 [Phycisphaerales bacterium]|nr:hypothetical protein [Phycisphaerales bacterium]